MVCAVNLAFTVYTDRDHPFKKMCEENLTLSCETATHVYEAGLDKRSSLDSVQQALFASHVTGKRPGVVIYDTDGREGRFEYRIKTACDQARVSYMSYAY